ncbi:unnamed protein product, partial [Meganyctiphanes norvegica]
KNKALFSLKAFRNDDGSIDYDPLPLNNTIKVYLPVHNVNSGTQQSTDLYLFPDIMNQLGLTKDEVSQGLIVTDDFSTALAAGLRLHGENYALWEYMPPHTEVFNSKEDIEPYTLYIKQISSMEDLKNDCTLVPEPNTEQDWSNLQDQSLEELEIQLKQNVLNITTKAGNQSQ